MKHLRQYIRKLIVEASEYDEQFTQLMDSGYDGMMQAIEMAGSLDIPTEELPWTATALENVILAFLEDSQKGIKLAKLMGTETGDILWDVFGDIRLQIRTNLMEADPAEVNKDNRRYHNTFYAVADDIDELPMYAELVSYDDYQAGNKGNLDDALGVWLKDLYKTFMAYYFADAEDDVKKKWHDWAG